MKEFPRPSIIVGTTNFDEFLADPTGNRRFWVVPIKAEVVPLEELASERDRIWAAAVHAFLKGETWTLPTELKQLAIETAREYEMSDPWEDPVMEYAIGLTRVTASDILLNALHMDIDRQDRASQMRVTNLLKANSWTTSREVVHGRRLRFWFPPSFKEIGCPSCPVEAETQTAVAGQPSGQPPGQPSGQPPDLPVESLNIPLLDNLDNLDNQIPKSTPQHESHLCKDENVSKSVNGSRFKPGCEIFLEGEWIPAIYRHGLNKSVFSPVTRKLETGHRVEIPDGPNRLMRWEVADSALRRLQAEGDRSCPIAASFGLIDSGKTFYSVEGLKPHG